MIRLLLVALILITGFSTTGHAQGRDVLDLNTLPDNVRADIMEKANRSREAEIRRGKDATKTADPVDISKKTREEMEAWGVLGAGAGKAVVSAAKEVGMAADEFAGTGLGKIVIALVLLKFVGKSLLAIAFGVALMLVGYRWGYRMIRPLEEVQYTHVPILFGLIQWKRSTMVKYGVQTEGGVVLGCLMIAMSTIIAAICFFV